MPLISIIVPVYKAENVLHYCVESILNQTFRDFELILVDDGSPDNSGKICDEYSAIDNRVRVIHKENGGVSSARNTGIDQSKGVYITFIDSDDFISSSYLSDLIELKKKYSDCNNIWCGFQTVKSYSKDFSIIQKVICSDSKKISTSSREEIMTLHEKWLDVGPYCKLYDKRIIVKNKIYFSIDLSLGEDLLFNFKYLDCTNGKIVILNQALYNYCVGNENSLGSKFYPNMLDIYKEINETMYFYLSKWKCSIVQFKKYYNAVFFKYEVILKNTFKNNTLSKKEKFRFNDDLLRSKDFINIYKKMDYKPNIFLRVAYSIRKYKVVLVMEKILKLLKG